MTKQWTKSYSVDIPFKVPFIDLYLFIYFCRYQRSGGNDAYRMDTPNSQLDFYQDGVPLRRKSLCYIACIQAVPFGPDKNLLRI